MPKTTSECNTCGKRFEYYNSQSNGIYCSNECKGGNKNLISVECSACGNELKREKYMVKRADEHQFCDNNCQWDWRKDNLESEDYHDYDDSGDVVCSNCGKEFHINPAEVGDNNYCSRQCMAEYYSENYVGEDAIQWKGGYKTYYGSNWSEMRKKSINRDDEICRVCGMDRKQHKKTFGKDIEVHHLKPIREFETPENANSLDNLITVCAKCHQKIEGKDSIPLDLFT